MSTRGLLMLLSGPLQSWGTHSTWSDRDTQRHPTRSGLIGMVAAAAGHPRHEPLDRFRPLRFHVRIDRPGQRLVDLHTAGGGRAQENTIPTASGGKKEAGKGTVMTHRHYLADAAFTVAATGPDDVLDDALAAFQAPRWAPYLGRRSCPAAVPFVLDHADAVHALHTTFPLARDAPRGDEEVPVEFVADHAPAHAQRASFDELADEPVRFEHTNRSYRLRRSYHYWSTLPATVCAGLGEDYLSALAHETSEATP